MARVVRKLKVKTGGISDTSFASSKKFLAVSQMRYVGFWPLRTGRRCGRWQAVEPRTATRRGMKICWLLRAWRVVTKAAREYFEVSWQTKARS